MASRETSALRELVAALKAEHGEDIQVMIVVAPESFEPYDEPWFLGGSRIDSDHWYDRGLDAYCEWVTDIKRMSKDGET